MRFIWFVAIFAPGLLAAAPPLEAGAKVILKWRGQNGRYDQTVPHVIRSLGRDGAIFVEETGWSQTPLTSPTLRQYGPDEYELVVPSFEGGKDAVAPGDTVLIRAHKTQLGWSHPHHTAKVTAVGAKGTVLTDVTKFEAISREYYLTSDHWGSLRGLEPGQTVTYKNSDHWRWGRTQQILWIGKEFVLVSNLKYGGTLYRKDKFADSFDCAREFDALVPAQNTN